MSTSSKIIRNSIILYTIVLIILSMSGFFAGVSIGYRSGQIDAALGNQSYVKSNVTNIVVYKIK